VILPTPVWLLNLARRFVSVPLDAAQLKRVEEDKRAVPADPPPPELAARTPLAEGLTQLAADLSAASETQAWRGRRRPA
jgi:hypothetical protein